MTNLCFARPMAAMASGCALLCALSFHAVPRSAQAQGAPADIVPGQYIVVFKAGVSPTVAAPGLARTYGLGVRHVYHSAVSGFSALVPPGQVAALARDPRVAYVEPDRIAHASAKPVPPPPAESLPWGVNRI